MLKHILVLFENQKRNYGGMCIGQMIVFIVVLYCFISIGDTMKRYYTLGRLETDNVISFYNYMRDNRVMDQDEELLRMDDLCRSLKNCSLVVAVTKSVQFLQYMRDLDNYLSDSIHISDKKMKVYIKGVDENTMQVFRPKLEEGKWLTNKPLDDGSYPIVITRQLMEEIGWIDAIGKKLICSGHNCTVVGVIAGFKHKPMSISYPTIIVPLSLCPSWIEYSILVKPGECLNFRNYLYKEFYKFFEKGKVDLGIMELDKLKAVYMQNELLSLIAIIVPTFFLLIFVFIGTFGLFWLYSSRRRKEFALRIVVGSTPIGLRNFVILEAILLTILSWIPGMILFFLIYSVNSIDLLALVATCFVMMLFSVFSAWWPAYQVSQVNPVEAMREE